MYFFMTVGLKCFDLDGQPIINNFNSAQVGIKHY